MSPVSSARCSVPVRAPSPLLSTRAKRLREPLLADVADILPPEWRPIAFGLNIGCFGIGQTIGPTLAANMSQEQTIIAVNGFAILTILLSFIVPESLEESARSEFQLGDINPFKQVAVLRAPPPSGLTLCCSDSV